MLIVVGKFPKTKSQQRFISRTKTRQEEDIKYTKYGIHTKRMKTKEKKHTHSKVPANRRNKSNLK